MEVARLACSPLDCLERWQLDQACQRPHRINRLTTKTESWNGRPRLASVNARQSCTFENSCGCTSYPAHAGVKGIDLANKLSGKAATISNLRLRRSEVLRSLKHYMWAQSQGHRTIDHQEKRSVERGSARQSSLKGMREGRCQSDKLWNRFRGNAGETSEGQGAAYTYQLELNWTDQ